MPSFAPTNGSSMCFVVGVQGEEVETQCRECKKSIFEGDLRLGKGAQPHHNQQQQQQQLLLLLLLSLALALSVWVSEEAHGVES
eukprot:COSAG02_NODE_1080_length_14710_cov_46.078913_13_plen_84_part_00